MGAFQNFPYCLYNLRKEDVTPRIREIVLEERKKIETKTTDFTGLCKYIAYAIEERLTKNHICTCYWVDLNNIISVDHVVLIAEFVAGTELKRLLIDPTYKQFTVKDERQLNKPKQLPCERLDKNILKNLLEFGVSDIDNEAFQNYLNSFGTYLCEINLDEYLKERKIGKRTQ